MTRFTTLASITVAAYTAITLALPAYAAPSAPNGCTITHGWDDGSRIAVCSDGSKVIAYDPDGQTHPDFPYRAPGTWRAIS